MKTNNFLSVILLFFLCFSNTCKTPNDEKTYIGTIVEYLSPCVTDEPWKNFVYGFETLSGDYYILTMNSHTITLKNNNDNPIVNKNIEYFIGDNVIIKGVKKTNKCNKQEYCELKIKTIEKWYPSKDYQHILGTYIANGICVKSYSELSFPMQDVEIILYEYIENSGLLFSIKDNFTPNNLYAFIVKDSLFIPVNWFPSLAGDMLSFSGRGRLENDSIFLNIVYGYYYYGVNNKEIWFESCDCKGKKIE